MSKVNRLAPKTRALQLNLEGLFKLLGGTPEEREQFWEKVTGMTTVVEFELVSHQIELMGSLVANITASAKEIQNTAATYGMKER